MAFNMLHHDYSIATGGIELLDRIAPLWMQLRQHHADGSPQWRDTILVQAFENRKAELLAKATSAIQVWIAMHRSEDIGYCVSTIAGDKGEIDSLFVSSAHRSNGIGHAFMSRSMDWLGSQNVRSILIAVLSGNEGAQKFYERYGFAPRSVQMNLLPGKSVGDNL